MRWENFLNVIPWCYCINCYYIEYESKGEKDKNLSPKKYLNMIRPYLSDIINDHKTMKKRNSAVN